MWIHLTLCSVTLVLCDRIGLDPISAEEATRTFPYRRAVDGSRGSKYYEPQDDDSFDIYDSYNEETDFAEYKSNVPGEPGIDYPSYTRIPQTSFTCESQFRGYYADEEAGCQLFHVCDGNFLVSSFLCPIGSTFSQKFLTCDWWNKVDCSATKNFYQTVNEASASEVDDDEYLRKAYEMTSLQTADNGVSLDPQDQANLNVNGPSAHVNDLQSADQYSDYQNAASRSSYPQFKYSSRYSSRNRNNDYYDDTEEKSSIRIHTIGKDKKDDEHQYNHFQPAYAPTVPTVTTTTRRFYSPTVPTIVRSTPRSRYDLEFESSDHLYSAKGKSRTTTVGPTLNALPSASKAPQSTFKAPAPTPKAPLSTYKAPLSTPKAPQLTFKASLPTTKASLPTTKASVIFTKTSLPTSNALLSTFNSLPSTTENIKYSSVTPVDLQELSYPEINLHPAPKDDCNISDDSNIIHLSLINTATDETPTESSTVPESPIIQVVSYMAKNDSGVKNATNSTWYESNVIIPSVSFLPPFYYYSGVDQHESVAITKSDETDFNSTASEESTTSWYDASSISIPPIEYEPPIRDKVDDLVEVQSSTLSIENSDLGVNKVTISALQSDSPIIHSLIDIGNATYPVENYEYEVVNRDDIQLGVTDDIYETSTSFNFLKDYFDEKKKELLGDLDEGESSPVQVTLTVNNDEELDPSGEFIRSLIAQHDPISADNFKDIEIVRSLAPNGNKSPETVHTARKAIHQKSERSRPRTSNYATNPSKTRHRSKFVEDRIIDKLPRPFSLNYQDIQNVNEFSVEKKSLPYSNSNPRNRTERKKNLTSSESYTELELPSTEKSAEFQSNKNPPKPEEIPKLGHDWNKTRIIRERYIVETELVPSIGFSLNTNEEREEFTDAVRRGFITDITDSSINVTDSKTDPES